MDRSDSLLFGAWIKIVSLGLPSVAYITHHKLADL
jgi:hypothetical protein